MSACESCGVELQIGDWPFCPHGSVRYGVIRDEIPGGFVQEHFGPQPETFYSWSAMRKRADELNLTPFVRQLEQIREGAYIDAQTMENARVLLTRGTRASDSDPAALQTFRGEIRERAWW